MTICSTITYSFPLLLNLNQSLVPLPIFWCFQHERGCCNLNISINRFCKLSPAQHQKYLSITPYESYFKELSIFHSQFQFIRLHTNPISNFRWNTISSHPIFQFCLKLIPSDQNSCLNLNLVSLDWNYRQISMNTTSPNPHKNSVDDDVRSPKCGVRTSSVHANLAIISI